MCGFTKQQAGSVIDKMRNEKCCFHELHILTLSRNGESVSSFFRVIFRKNSKENSKGNLVLFNRYDAVLINGTIREIIY